MNEIKIRVALLEAAQRDNTSKITTLIEGCNSLNLNLANLVTSINTSIRVTFIAVSFAASIACGIWAYYTFSITHPQIEYTLPKQIGNK